MSTFEPCSDGCVGWNFFELSNGTFDIERCDACDRFPSDFAVLARLATGIATSITCRDQGRAVHAVRLLTSGGTARQWEELIDWRGSYFDKDGTLREPNGERSIFDDVDE